MTHPERTPVVMSWSGGKDSSLALAALQAGDQFNVVALLTSITQEYDRVSIHGVRRALLEAQARVLRLPLFEVALQPMSSNEAYEAAFAEGVAAVMRAFPDVRHMAFGDLFLADVRAYREQQIGALGLSGVFPLWGRNTAELAEQFVRDGYVAHLVCVDTTQLDASFCGRVYDDALLVDLPSDVDPCGENGEFHTFVSAAPIFGTPVHVQTGEVVLRDGRFAYCDLLS
ncbi:MAG TPA: hypothetical protein VE869_10170 [Gemmatimonas sp.]|nr:hypothetical protein [Gemmatimonas sp.]